MMVHVTAPDVARRLRRLDGASAAMVTFTDNLLIGPCTREVVQLAEARRSYWSGVPSGPRNLQREDHPVPASPRQPSDWLVKGLFVVEAPIVLPALASTGSNDGNNHG